VDDRILVIYYPEEGSDSADKLRLLAVMSSTLIGNADYKP
jgi:hypothetical protein